MRAAERPLLFALVGLLAGARPLAAQSVVELQAGGSSLYDSYGVSGTLYTPRYEAWLGVGWQDGFRIGGALQTSFGKDSLRVGSDALLIRYPTDLFSIGVNVLTQSVRYTLVRPRLWMTASTGAAAAAPQSQFFQAFSFDAPYGSLSARYLARRTLVLGFDGAVAAQQSALASAEWLVRPDVSVGATGGIGSNAAYGAVSAAYRGRTVTARASFVDFAEGFRRVELPFPVQSEAKGANVAVDWSPTPDVSLGVGRQGFAQDSGSGVVVTATGTSAYGAYRWRGLRAQAALYYSSSQGITNLSNSFALGTSLGRWLDVESYLLQSRPSVGDATNTPVVNLRERVHPRLALVQQITWNDAVTVRVGGDLVTPWGDLGVSYSIIQQPFRPQDPFQSVLSLTARLQLGRVGTTVSTTFLPDGSVAYVAGASSYLYFGSFGGSQPNVVAAPVGRFVLRGRVVDDQGHGVDGAVLDFDGEVAITNQEGQFLIRVRRPREFPLRLAFDEFLDPGPWEVVSVPLTVQALKEERAPYIEIILRRAVPPLAEPPAP
ncbi:MAG TPA: hypothetical protein VFY20_00485 [Gemmatimonadales bacterium]|nr:hypothetical protein [Gemmatimonadales bacterium]